MIEGRRGRPPAQPVSTMSPPAHGPWTRRRFLVGAASMPAIAWAGRARADEPRRVRVPHVAFGAIVVAVGGDDVTVEIDPDLPVATLEAEGTTLGLVERLLLKGKGDDRRRYLDDARNAPKLGAAVRDGLRSVWPDLGDGLARRHKAWSRELAREVLGWSQRLSEAGLRDKRIRDPGGRIYLLEWAGAVVTNDGAAPPPGLAGAPTEPTAATPDAYREYVQALVGALSHARS